MTVSTSPATTGSATRASSLRSALILTLILGAAFLFSHPYTGVRHDGILYAGEALSRMLPGEFHDDPYFRFGSQGRFTVLPYAYASLISLFGFGRGTMVGMLVAFALYLAATAWMVKWLAPRQLVAACMLSVVLGWSIYGGHRIFAYAEPFLTARSFAESANLLSLGLVVRRRLFLGAAALLLAFLIHPLISIGGALVIWVYLVLQDRRWLLLALVGAVGFVVCALMGFGPFNDVFIRYDRQWLDYLQEVNPQAFVSTWTMLDWSAVAFNAGVMIFAARMAQGEPHRRLALAVIAAVTLTVLVSIVMVDLAGSAFVGKLQISRIVWLMQWLAAAVLPLIVIALWSRGQHGRVAALLLVIGWIAPFSIAPGIVALMALSIDTIGRRFEVTATTTRIVVGIMVLTAVIIVGQFELRVFQMGVAQQQTTFAMLSQAIGIGALLMVAALLFLRAVPRLGSIALPVAVLVFAIATVTWDQRSPWKHRLESVTPGAYLWADLIEPTARVYWFKDLMAPWLLLGHANYYTDQQASGAVFSREMVVELQKRQKITATLDFQEQICRLMNSLNEKQGSCEPDVAAVRTVCVDGGIDYVVMQSLLAGPSPLAQYSTGVTENGYEKKFFLYRCSTLNPG